MFPRGGGVWDQDPILMRDFRLVRKFEQDWKEAQRQVDNAQREHGFAAPSGGGGVAGIGDALNQYIEQMDEEGAF